MVITEEWLNMSWINKHWQAVKINLKQYQIGQQDKLILLIILPCVLITIFSLLSTNASPYLIAFILVCLSLLSSYVFIATRNLARYQIRTLANLIESMIDGDYSLRGRLKGNQAFHELLLLINNLSETLAQHKVSATESRILLELIVEQMDAMVLATNPDGKLVMANASAKALLLNNIEHIAGISLGDLKLGKKLQDAESGIVEFTSAVNNNVESSLAFEGDFFLHKESFLRDGQPHKLYLLTNAERLLMEKERNAWQSVLRVLSHEINNSLTPISTISQSIQTKLQRSIDSDIAFSQQGLIDGMNIINERADSLSSFIASYSQLAHLPKPIFELTPLRTLIEKLAKLFPSCDFKIADSTNIKLMVDNKQLEQVLINLFKNAIDAMIENERKLIEIHCREQQQWQQIVISDYGCGVANIDNLFVPFYTTKQQGSGIGLALCRQIMFIHHGQIKIQNKRQGPGVEAILAFPI